MSEFGSPVPINLDGVEYRFSPLSYGDIEELDNWVRHEYMRRVTSAIPADAPDKELAWRIAQDKVADMTWLSGTGAKLIASVKGMVKIAQLSLQKRHPELTDAKLLSIIQKDKDAFKKMSHALKESAGPASPFPPVATVSPSPQV